VHRFEGFSLVAIQLLDPTSSQTSAQPLIQPIRIGSVGGRTGRDDTVIDYRPGQGRLFQELPED
jgi:hypothetical protein